MDNMNALWGGILTSFSLDPLTQSCELAVQVQDGGTTENHIVVCSNVVDCHFYNSILGPWSYAELTEVEVSYDRETSLWIVELMLWSEDAGIRIKCDDISVNGSRLPASSQP